MNEHNFHSFSKNITAGIISISGLFCIVYLTSEINTYMMGKKLLLVRVCMCVCVCVWGGGVVWKNVTGEG